MSNNRHELAPEQLRWGIYGLLIALSVGGALGRLLAVNSVDNVRLETYLRKHGQENRQLQRPFLSSNDRSRWATVRALVEKGTYAIDQIVCEPNWDTIDMVKHRDRDGVARLYSSKPPILATVVAAPYWLVSRLTGWTLGDHPYEVGRILLVACNIIPLALMFVLLARMVERLGTSSWGRLYVLAAATGGTLLSTFVIVLNNHLIAAVSVTVALASGLRIWLDGDRRARTFAVCGLFAALTAACELPAVSFLALVATALAWRFPRQTLAAFAPAALVVVVAFFATNYAAHQSLRPPYMHRSETDPEDNWYIYTFERDGRERQSYWSDRHGIDRGEPSRLTYALHVLVGHHGIFSLTPMWILSVLGVGRWLAGPRPTPPGCDPPGCAADRPAAQATNTDTASAGQESSESLRPLAALITITSLTCIVFFLLRPQMDRNYGGMTSGFRWLFWLAPMWLLAMVPAADAWSGCRGRRAVALVLLGLSALSVTYPTWNPWTHPWITNYLLYLEWLKF